MTAFWLTFKARLLLILAIVAGALSVAFKIRQSGRAAERADNLESTIKTIQKKEGVAREIDRMPDGGAADRLRDKWSRD